VVQVDQSISHLENLDSFNERSLNILARAINLSKGHFSLIIVNCNYRSLRQKALATFNAEMDLLCRELWWHESDQTLYEKLQNFWRKEDAEYIPVLMCLGLENSRTNKSEDSPNLFLEANLFRDRLKQNLKCPLVLWLDDPHLQKFLVTAPELANLAAPLIKLDMAIVELEREVQQQVERLLEIMQNPQIPLFWQDTKIDCDREVYSCNELEIARRELRIAYQKNNQQPSPEMEAKLDFLLGRLLWRSPEALHNSLYEESNGAVHSISQIYYQYSLAYWQKENRLIESGIVLFYLGSLWWHYSFENGRQAHESWLKAKSFFQEAIASFGLAERTDLVAKYSRYYSRVLEQLKQWQELEIWIKSLMLLHQQMPLELAQDYGYLAKIAEKKREWATVQDYAYSAISTLEKVSTFEDEHLKHHWQRLCQIQLGQYRLLLTQSHLQLGELDIAADLIKRTIDQFNITDEPKLYIQFLDTFHDIAFAQELYLEAFQAKQQQRSLEQQYGLRAFIGAAVLQPKQFSSNPDISLSDASKFEINASEIVSSGRQQDVDRLVERIIADDHQLTVIHGESGVGKSSLIRAGLLPSLLQRVLIGQELIVAKLRVYTDWINSISLSLYISHDLDDKLYPLTDNSLQSNFSSRKYRERRQNGDRHTANLLNRIKLITASGTQIVIILDQFEEFFFTYPQPHERQTFIEFWQKCLKIPLLKFVISIREDYLYLLLELESAHPEIDILSRDFRYALGNLSKTDAKSLIENLTEQANFPLEPSLVDELVRDLASDQDTVRPIELQVVGSQLQDRNITTLDSYRLAGGKQRLVEKFVEEVIQACGKSAFIAQQVLILLTDEQGKRPLLTYNDLHNGILTYSSDTRNLDLVLEILIGSGLIFQVSDIGNNRYQLIHDYLVPFIRANQESGLQEELFKVRSFAQRSQTNLNHLTKMALAITLLGLLIMVGLAFQADRQRQLAEFGEIEALVSSAKSSFLLDNQLESLTTIIKSAKKFNTSNAGVDRDRIAKSNLDTLQMIVYSIRERYRFNPQKMDAPFYAAKFSHNGKIMAFGSYDGSVYLVHSNGKPISRLIGFKAIEIRGLSFSPDDRQIASTGQGKSVRIWDIETGKLVSKFYAHQDDIFRVHFHPEGKMLLTASKDGTAKLWDRDRAIELLTINPKLIENATPISKKRGSIAIQDANFSPDGKFIITAKSNTIALWDLRGNLLASAIAHDQKVNSFSFAPNGKQLVTSGDDETVKLWQIVEKTPVKPVVIDDNFGESNDASDSSITVISEKNLQNSVSYQLQLVRTFKTTSTDIVSVKFSNDGKHIALGAQDNSIQIINTDGILEMKLGGHTNTVFDVDFSPDDRYLLSASKDKTVRLWDLRVTLLDTFYGHTDNIWSVNVSPDGKIFASGSVDKSVRIWNADGGLRTEIKGHEDTVYGVSFSADGKKLVTASNDKTVRIWDVDTGKLLNLLNIHGSGLVYATFSPDQKTLATLGIDNKIKLWRWDNTDQPKLLQVLDGHSKTVWAIAFSPDSQSLASTSNDQTVKVWNVINGKNVRTMEAHTNGGLAVAYSPDGKQIASAGKDGKLKLWNAQTGTLEKVIIVNAESWIYGINFSPDGKAIATANADKTIKIMDLGSGELLKNLTGHIAEVNTVSYSPNGKYIISGSRDNTLKLWDAETLTFNQLVDRGCSLLENYLEYTPTLPRDQKQLCK
jgi:WD40 repeat protein